MRQRADDDRFDRACGARRFFDHVDHRLGQVLAWSPTRSMALATNTRSMLAEMVRGSSIVR